MNSRLAGIIKEEYYFRDMEKLTPHLAKCIGVYDEAHQRWTNRKPKKKEEYNLMILVLKIMPLVNDDDHIWFSVGLKMLLSVDL